ncbi:MAG: hypothetical protein J3T61_10625, partial [Candidatus Brocadiales bacterium]|nr:hypothetical protein [Candidatus Bathyanammoxibius sp.]
MKYSSRFIILVIVVTSLFVGTLDNTARAAEIALYVSPEGSDSWSGDSIDKPFATIQKARDAIRAMMQRAELTEPVTVYLRGGTYELSETLVFTPEDSGTASCPITYAAYENEEPIVSGSRKIAGPWKDYQGKIKVCTIDEVKAGKWFFRQLFLNGKRQIRARSPNDSFHKGGTFYKVADIRYSPDGGVTWIESEAPPGSIQEELGRDAFRYRDQDFRKWTNLNDVEVVLLFSWNEARLRVSEVDEEQKIITFTGRLGRRMGG